MTGNFKKLCNNMCNVKIIFVALVVFVSVQFACKHDDIGNKNDKDLDKVTIIYH